MDSGRIRPPEGHASFGCVVFVAVDDDRQFACGRVDDGAVDDDVGGHQRVAADDADGVAHAVFNAVKACEPCVEVDACVP